MTIDISQIKTRLQATDALEALLLMAKQAIASQNNDQKLAVIAQLEDFVAMPEVKYDELDKIANQTIEDLAIAVINTAIGEIAARNADLLRYRQQLEGITGKTQEQIRDLRFADLIEGTARMQTVVDSFKKMENTMTNPDKNLLAKLADLKKMLDELNKV
jgi:hypothetical protein